MTPARLGKRLNSTMDCDKMNRYVFTARSCAVQVAFAAEGIVVSTPAVGIACIFPLQTGRILNSSATGNNRRTARNLEVSVRTQVINGADYSSIIPVINHHAPIRYGDRDTQIVRCGVWKSSLEHCIFPLLSVSNTYVQPDMII